MQTSLSSEFSHSAKANLAKAIIRKCVHCGFCNATCPTYQLLGDELDGPRGRIYLIKQLLEGEPGNAQMTLHLNRCLSCRACETTCPSGVKYAQLLEIGRATLSDQRRSMFDQWLRIAIAKVVSNAEIFAWLLRCGRALRPLLPSALKAKIPLAVPDRDRFKWPDSSHTRRMVALAGCVQGTLSPMTNLAAAVVLDRLGISLMEISAAGCCGAVDLHTTDEARAKIRAKALIDMWWPCLQQGIEGFVMTASGCGVTIMEYPQLLRDEPNYVEKAQAISEKTFDLCEVIDKEMDATLQIKNAPQKVAFHAPCTLQHGQKITDTVESILQRVGYQLCQVKDAHLCCGSAGSYSILHPKIATQLGKAKLGALYNEAPDIVCTANVGCQTHLNMHLNGHTNGRAKGCADIKHWIELLL